MKDLSTLSTYEIRQHKDGYVVMKSATGDCLATLPCILDALEVVRVCNRTHRSLNEGTTL